MKRKRLVGAKKGWYQLEAAGVEVMAALKQVYKSGAGGKLFIARVMYVKSASGGCSALLAVLSGAGCCRLHFSKQVNELFVNALSLKTAAWLNQHNLISTEAPLTRTQDRFRPSRRLSLDFMCLQHRAHLLAMARTVRQT